MERLEHRRHAGRLGALQRLGYRQHGIHSPYVWACTDQYAKGRYVADGKFDANAETRQCGAVAMLKGLIAAGVV